MAAFRDLDPPSLADEQTAWQMEVTRYAAADIRFDRSWSLRRANGDAPEAS